MTLDERDQEVWCRTDAVARALVALLPALHVDTVYAPALQCGHPDHDGVYVAAQLARAALGNLRLDWRCYALYALDGRGTPGYGWLHPGLYPRVTNREFTPEVPKNTFVAGFLNINNGPPPISLIDGRRMPQGETLAQMWVGVRPEDVEMSGEPRAGGLPGTIGERISLPPRNTTFLAIRIGEHEVHAQTAGR